MAKKLSAKQSKASQTAKAGLRNEEHVADLFSSWPSRATSLTPHQTAMVEKWLKNMGHAQPHRLKNVIGQTHRDTEKRDITVRAGTSTHKISVKLISSRRASTMNHLQRLTPDSFQRQFAVPDNVMDLLKLYTGATTPTGRIGLKDKRRVKAPEFTPPERQLVENWLTANQVKVLQGIFCGPNSNYAPGWMLVMKKNRMPTESALRSIGDAITFFKQGGVRVERTSFRIGKIIIQRKGGEKGPSGNDLQFKAPFGLLPKLP